MKLTIKKKINGNTMLEAEVEGKNDKEALFKASIYMGDDICGLCKSTDVKWESNKTKDGHIYIKKRCMKCTATSVLGEYKDQSGYFWHSNWEIYKPEIKAESHGKEEDGPVVNKEIPF